MSRFNFSCSRKTVFFFLLVVLECSYLVRIFSATFANRDMMSSGETEHAWRINGFELEKHISKRSSATHFHTTLHVTRRDKTNFTNTPRNTRETQGTRETGGRRESRDTTTRVNLQKMQQRLGTIPRVKKVETAVLVAGLGCHDWRSGCQGRCERRSWNGAVCCWESSVSALWDRRQTGQSSRSLAPARLDGKMQVQRSRQVRWTAEVGVNARVQAVMDHEFCAGVLQSAVVLDQLNVSELACMDLI